MPLSPTALKRAMEAAGLAASTSNVPVDHPSEMYVRALIQAYLSDEEVLRAGVAELYGARCETYVATAKAVLRAIGGR